MSNYSEVMLGFAFLSATLGSDSTLLGYAPGGVWRAYAPPGTATPYIIMAHQAGHTVTTMNAFRLMVDNLFQVKAVGPASGTSQIASAAARIDQLLGGPPSLPASGPVIINAVQAGQVLSCYQESPLQVDELVNGEAWANIGAMYRMIIEQIAT